MGAIGLDRDRNLGWDFGRPVGVAPVGGAAMIGFRDCGAAGLDIRVTAMPAVTVVIEFGENEPGRQALTGFVAGLPTGTMRIRSERVECIEVRLSPVQAYALLGAAPTDLGGAVVGLEDLWGRRALWLREQLADAVTWEERFALTRSFLVQCDEPTRTAHPEVVASWGRIVASRGRSRSASWPHHAGGAVSGCGRGSRPHCTRCWTFFVVDSSRISDRPVRAISARRRDHVAGPAHYNSCAVVEKM